MLTSTLLYGGLIPAAAALVATLLAARLRTTPSAQWASGVTAGVIVGLLALKSRAGFSFALQSVLHPSEAADWVPLIVLVAWLAAMLRIAGDALASQPSISPAAPSLTRALVNVASLLITIAVPLRLLSGNVRLAREWSALDKLACLTILAAALAIVWRLLATPDNHRQAIAKPALLIATSLVAALVLTFSAHVFVYGEACATLAAALTGTALARVLPLSPSSFPSIPPAAPSSLPLPPGEGRGEGRSASASRTSWIAGLHGAAAPITFTLGSYLNLGHFFADLSTLSATLLTISLVAAGGPLPARLTTRPLWQQFTIRSTVCFLLLILTLISALR